VARAVASGLQGTSTALLDFGIRLDEAYVLSLGVNRGFKAMEDAITPAQMAQARYNAIMEQTADINGKAAETQDDASRAMQKFRESMDDAMASVGEAILPIAQGVANFIANIPEPLLQAGTWIALGGGIAVGLGGAVIGINALRKAVTELGVTSTESAIQVQTASVTANDGLDDMTTGMGNLAMKAGAVAAALPIIADAINELIKGIRNDEDYHENKYTRMLGSIQDAEGGPGWWDELIEATRLNRGAIGSAIFGESTETADNYDWNTEGLQKHIDALFQSWLLDTKTLGASATRSDLESFKAKGEGFTTMVDLPGGGFHAEPYTYEGLKQWFLENQTKTYKQGGATMVEVNIYDRTDGGVQPDASAHAESNY
ncbi:MAG: hypothetical protein JW990_12930, partial [Thermoleophilia bacterium]|nr:hypothetical protein [Thermoleophilia bacterium]